MTARPALPGAPARGHLKAAAVMAAGGRAVSTWLPLALLFLAYPLAVFVPARVGVPLRFHFALPCRFWLSLWAAGVVLALLVRGHAVPSRGSTGLRTSQIRLNTILPLAALAALVLCVLSGVHGGSPSLLPVLGLAGLFAVPVAVACGSLDGLRRRLPAALALLWAVNAAHALWQWRVGAEVVGIAGNRNWFAGLVVGLAPWPWVVVQGGGASGAAGWRRGMGWAVGGVGLVVTVALAWVAGSRSAFVALAGYAVWRLFWRVRPALARAALVVGLVAAVAAAAWLGRGALMQAARDDVRLPLWQSTLRLAVGHPLLGIGPGNFRREFVAFRQPAQMAKPTTANVTEHPHNELLNVWATGGVLLALAWAAAAVSLLARPRGGGSVSAAHFTAVILFGQSCFDLTLARSPTDLAALLCLGLAWHPFVDASADEGVPEAWPSRTWIAAALAVGLAAAGVWLGGRAAISSWLLRQGAVAESRDEAAAAYEAHATAAKWSVGDPQPDYFAGIVAPRALRSPQLALRHFEAVRNLEPDFVHLNGEIGLALAQAGGHEPALPFFARDAALFPYDVIAQSRHVQCAFNTGQSEGIEAALAALAKARVAERRRALGAETVSGLVRTIERAWERDDDDAGIAAVNRLLNGIPRLPPEPLSRHLIPPATDPAGEWADELTPDDWGTCRRAYKGVPWGRTDGTPQPVAEACLGHGAEDVEAEEDGRGDSGQRVMECFRESGWDVARVLGGDGRDLGWLALRTGTVVQHMHLVQLGGEHGVLTDVTAERLASDADLRRRLGVNDADELGIEVALAAADFSPRLQYLGDVLRCVAPHLRSRLGESPTLRLWRWQQALDCPAGHASDPFPAAPSDQTPRVRVTARLDPDGPEATPGR